MNSSEVVTNLVGHYLPFIVRGSRDACPASNLPTVARLRLNLTKLTKPSDTDLAAGRTIGHQMPKTCAIAAALSAPPGAKDAQTSIEVHSDAIG